MEMKELLEGLSSNLGIDSLAIIGGEAAIDLDVYAAIKDHIVTQKNARSPMARSGPSTSTACPY